MAQVLMTDAQRDQLIADPNFLTACRQALMDQAVYTRGQNGVGMATAQAAQQWAQWRPWAAQIIENPNLIYGDSQIAYQFALFISTRGLTCWDNVANTTAAAIAWLTSNNHFGANDLAQDWFTLKTYKGSF